MPKLKNKEMSKLAACTVMEFNRLENYQLRVLLATRLTNNLLTRRVEYNNTLRSLHYLANSDYHLRKLCEIMDSES